MKKQSALAKFVIRFPWPIVVFFVALTVLFAAQLPKAQIDTDMKSQLPADLPTRVNLEKIEELFGGTDMAMLVVEADDVLATETLTRIRDLTEKMQRVDEFDRVVSVFTAKDLRGEDGEMIVESAIPRIPESDEDRAALREQLAKNPLVLGNLVSKDYKYAVLIGFLSLEAEDEVLLEKLDTIIRETPGDEEVFIGGMPLTRVSLTQDMRKDMRRFLPIGLAIMIVFLLVCFRQAIGVILPFVMTVMAIIVSMGLVPLLGWKIHTVTILLPVILLAVANDYGIHLMARYQEDNVPGLERSSADLVERGVTELMRPVLATGLTTVVGMLCMLSHVIIPAKQLGWLAAWGVGFAMVGSLVFLPALLVLLPPAKPIATPTENATRSSSSFIDGLLTRVATMVPRRPKAILLACVAVCLAVGAGTFKVVVDTNPMSFYRETEPVWHSTHVLNEHLGGWAGVSVVFEGDIKDPKVLQRIDDLEQHLRKHPLVGTTTSIAGVMREMNRVMNDGDPAYDRLPETRELVAQYLLLYSMSGDAQDFEKLVDFPYEHAHLMVKVTDSGTKAATEILDYTRAYLAEHDGKAQPMLGGLLDVMAEMVGHIVTGQIWSIALSVVLVGALVGIFMRSAVAAAISMFPLALALLMIFGIMGLFGIELNLITALLSSIMIGVGVDYTIHFLWRYRDERHNGLSPEVAVHRTLVTTGRGIVFNGLSVVVGFAVLIVSNFFPVQFFGLLVAISILACLAGALVVLPAIVLVFRPKFLEP